MVHKTYNTWISVVTVEFGRPKWKGSSIYLLYPQLNHSFIPSNFIRHTAIISNPARTQSYPPSLYIQQITNPWAVARLSLSRKSQQYNKASARRRRRLRRRSNSHVALTRRSVAVAAAVLRRPQAAPSRDLLPTRQSMSVYTSNQREKERACNMAKGREIEKLFIESDDRVGIWKIRDAFTPRAYIHTQGLLTKWVYNIEIGGDYLT